MEGKNTERKQQHQKTYRRSQSNKGLVRFELQVSAESKARFDTLVNAAADEYAKPWDPRRRKALARTQVFDEITHGVAHEFFALKDQILALKAEIKALSPAFFKTPATHQTTPLPEAIRALPDDTQSLKSHLSKMHRDSIQAKRDALKYMRLATQYEALYEVATNYNEDLENRLKKQSISNENTFV